ncbi:S8 family serine peptidase [Natronolimnobius sp. AArcel1]|nr:S8 family serine peptidase [Natronolimnobius sp. AArcel1]
MERIRAFEAHDIATGDGTTIAVIDTGVDHTHPDLEPQLDRERSRLFRNGTVHSGTQEINVATELEPVERFVATDVEGHGSHVAGIAAASGTESGIVGVAPDATLVSLRPFFFENPQDGLFSLSSTIVDLLIAIDYAVEIGVDVINISLTAGDPDPGSVDRRRVYAAFNRIVEYALERGTAVVAAMGNAETGNDGINMDQFPGYILPASNSGTISVAAVTEDDVRSQESHFGDSTVTVAAPGDQILSTVPDELFWDQYYLGSGTSTAAPQVAGLACLLRELDPNLHPRSITQAMEKGATDLTGERTSGLGTGRIDTFETVDSFQ